MNISADSAILLVGAGRMGGALLRGWLAQGIEASRIFVQEPSIAPEMAEFLQDAGVAVGNPPALPSAPAVMLLAVKPQIMDDVLPTIAPLAGPETVVLSIAAGRTIASIAKHFVPEAAIVRAMPNTPAAIGRGMTVLCANQATTQPHHQLCEELLHASGEVAWVDDEALMDAVTAVSGSGPAYVFLLAECLAEAGKAAGLPPEMAARLARETVAGAGELLHQSTEDAAELRRAVTSPGGTTAAALAVLMGEGDTASAATGPLGDLIRRTAEAAAKRSRELAK